MPTAPQPRELVDFVQEALAGQADPIAAPEMQAYMKTEMPFYGVRRPARRVIFREVRRRFVPTDRGAWEQAVRALWALPHREERYFALDYARQWRRFHVPESLPLFEDLVRTGQWWDFVDDVAANLVGPAVLRDRAGQRPRLDAWIDDDDMWIRRTALLHQLKYKDATDQEQLFDYCRRRAHEPEFFIRKAIGWALRQHAAVAPEAVRDFLLAERESLSGLSYREASRAVLKAGLTLRPAPSRQRSAGPRS